MLWRKKDNRRILNFITLPNLRPHFSQLSFTPWRCLQSQHSIVTTSSLLMIYMKNTCFRGLSVLKLCSKISQKCCSPRKSVVLGLVVTKPAAVEPVAARCLWLLIYNIYYYIYILFICKYVWNTPVQSHFFRCGAISVLSQYCTQFCSAILVIKMR